MPNKEKILLPEHLADLKKSGLLLETIEAAGLFSIPSPEIPKVLGWDIPVKSLLGFPYSGNGFIRYKLFPEYKQRDGHTMRYYQKKDSGLHAYFPPEFDPEYSIFRITEGEKKALKGCQENLNVLGLGGIWNFAIKENGVPHLIDDLKQIKWTNKKVELIPDGDFQKNESVSHAVYRLGEMLQREGASIQVVVLPEVEKLDDFLVKFDVSEFYKLPRLDLDEPMFRRAKLKEDFGADHFTDLGLGKRFIAEHGRDLRFCYPWGTWIFFDGNRWIKDVQGEIDRRGKDIPRILYREASAIENEDRRKARVKFAMSAESEARRKAMIASAQSEERVPILPDELDQNPFLLNVLNGTIDLKIGQLKPHDRKDLISKLAPVEYHTKAECPLWIEFLNQIMTKNQGLIDFIQRAVGYSLTGVTVEQVLFFLWGLGANGKTTFLEIIKALMGDYGQTTGAETLMAKKQTGGIPNDIAGLRAARFVSAMEIESGQRLAESLVKQLTGGDRISARFLHSEFFEFTPQFKLWIGANHKPIIRGTDYAIWRRIQLIPFTVQIPTEKQDHLLIQKLKNELSGILLWAIQGCLKWQAEGRLIPPGEVVSATETYREEMDLLSDFIKERCHIDQLAKVRVRDLYRSYLSWSEETGDKRPITQREFSRRIEERGFSKRPGAGNAYFFHGIGLLEVK